MRGGGAGRRLTGGGAGYEGRNCGPGADRRLPWPRPIEKSEAVVYGYDGNRVVQDFAKLQGTLTGDLTGRPLEAATCCWWPCIHRSP